jgi:hypothetical protein
MPIKYYAQATCDFSRTIEIGALTVRCARTGAETVLAPPKTVTTSVKAGHVAAFSSKKMRDAYVTICNAARPGSVAPISGYERIAASKGGF